MLGICNGFQILTEAGLLPGVLRPNASLSFVCRDVALRVDARTRRSPRAAAEATTLTIPVKHGEGCWFADPELLEELEANGQIVLRYAAGENPNGAVADVAGVTNADGNVFGLMPHPEHAVDPLLGSTDGALILGSLVDAARLSSAAPVQGVASHPAERLRERRMIADRRRPETLEVSYAQRDRPAPGRAAGRVREAHERSPRSFSSSWRTDANRFSRRR